MINLEGKRILFVGIGFYDYESSIKKALEARGATVSFFSSTNQDYVTRLLMLLGLRRISNYRNRIHRRRKIKHQQVKNDIVFVIKGEELTREDMLLIKQNNKDASYVLYLWDSLVRHANLEMLFPFFNEVWSFDRIDCQNNPALQYRPLYYRARLGDKTAAKQYDISFIGWMHSDRYHLLKEIKQSLVSQGKTYYFKLYTGYFSYLVNRYVKKTITKKDEDLFIFKPISYRDYLDITQSSRYVLDIAHPQQSGLTIRTLEALACNCKLVTTNADISNYTGIPTDAYLIYERSKSILSLSSDETQFTISDYYSIDYFIDEIFRKYEYTP